MTKLSIIVIMADDVNEKTASQNRQKNSDRYQRNSCKLTLNNLSNFARKKPNLALQFDLKPLGIEICLPSQAVR